MRTLLPFGLLALVACGPPAPAPKTAPTPTPTATVAPKAGPPPADPFEAPQKLQREKLPAKIAFPLQKAKLGKTPKAVGKVPRDCSAFVKRKPKKGKACDSRDAALSQLHDALATGSVPDRDAKLVQLESCGPLPKGMVRALRAELAPTACADAIAGSMVDKPPAGIEPAIHDALVGLALAGRLRRLAVSPPKLAPPHDKKRVKAFIKDKMWPWTQAQAKAIHEVSKDGIKLRYYGKAIVAVEAGMAQLRFVEAMRGVPVPDEFKKDKELENEYIASLEQGLDKFKTRGRDAALVGLGRLATVGVIRDPRVDLARDLLSRLYGGRPINALDALMLPPLKPVTAKTPEEKLAARIPTFYASYVIPEKRATDPVVLRMLIEKGLSVPHRRALAGATLDDTTRALAARARLELAQNYWRSVDVDEAVGLLSGEPKGAKRDDEMLIYALSLALYGGPANAAKMMLEAPLHALGIGRVDGLDAIAKDSGPHGGRAAMNAALILELASPRNANADHWTKLAKRFDDAAERLSDVKDKKLAASHAKDARSVAEFIAASGKGK